MDAKQLEDLEFDRLIGKSSIPTPLTEDDISNQLQLPFIKKHEEGKVLEQYQANKLDGRVLNNYVNNDEYFKSCCLKMIVPDHKDVHPRLNVLPPVPQFEQPQNNQGRSNRLQRNG